MATVYNLAIDQGATFQTTVQVNDQTGTARNITGFEARGQLRRSYQSTANIQFNTAINNPANGEVVVSLTAGQTANLKYGRYVYDIELTSNSAVTVERILEGIVTVYPEVTK